MESTLEGNRNNIHTGQSRHPAYFGFWPSPEWMMFMTYFLLIYYYFNL